MVIVDNGGSYSDHEIYFVDAPLEHVEKLIEAQFDTAYDIAEVIGHGEITLHATTMTLLDLAERLWIVHEEDGRPCNTLCDACQCAANLVKRITSS